MESKRDNKIGMWATTAPHCALSFVAPAARRRHRVTPREWMDRQGVASTKHSRTRRASSSLGTMPSVTVSASIIRRSCDSGPAASACACATRAASLPVRRSAAPKPPPANSDCARQ